jgi:ribosomal protein S12 methylthiotransferase accessory factor
VPAVPPLRSLPADTAVQFAIREAERLDMRLEARFTGLQRYPTVVSRLIRGHTAVMLGAGKGKGAEGLAGAHFEALERYYISAGINCRLAARPVCLRKARDIAHQPGLADDLVIQRWAEDYPQSVAACAIHSNAASSVWYPIFLADPLYHLQPLPGDSVEPYRSMVRYTSSLGTAAGLNAQEAHLHGLCELIEHDACSNALLRWFVARIPQADIVDISSLPDHVKLLYYTAREAAGAEVILFDVTTDIGVPSYLAIKDCDGAEVTRWGAGASPIGEDAALRALNELIQMAVLMDGIEARSARKRLASWPVLQECLTAPSRLFNYRDVKRVPLRGDAGDVSTVESALNTVTNLIRQHGIHAYICELTPPESLISVISTIAPGLERFSLVRMGIPVVPTGRGWSIWTSAKKR